MDDQWESQITEYGAINITGFRIVDTERRYVREFLDGWKRLDPVTSIGAGKESITVCIIHGVLYCLFSICMYCKLFVLLIISHLMASECPFISLFCFGVCDCSV